jgi:hypothetical protein
LLDAGGGTVDAITYSVQGRARDIRLKKEEVMADGKKTKLESLKVD